RLAANAEQGLLKTFSVSKQTDEWNKTLLRVACDQEAHQPLRLAIESRHVARLLGIAGQRGQPLDVHRQETLGTFRREADPLELCVGGLAFVFGEPFVEPER